MIKSSGDGDADSRNTVVEGISRPKTWTPVHSSRLRRKTRANLEVILVPNLVGAVDLSKKSASMNFRGFHHDVFDYYIYVGVVRRSSLIRILVTREV